MKQELEKEKEANAALTKSLQDALDQNFNMKDEMQMKESLKGKKSDPEAGNKQVFNTLSVKKVGRK